MRKQSWHRIGASVFAFILVSGCAVSPPTGGLTAKGVIFSAEQTAVQGRRYLELPAPYWTPAVSDVAELEAKLPAFLRSSGAPRADAVMANLDRSKRQYLGYSLDGRKRIFVNGFCDGYSGQGTSWQTHLVVVLDGGPCFYQIHYDVQTATFAGLSVNGET